MKYALFTLASIGFSLNQAHAFVENIIHGYSNCLACHVSPSGGGVLNDYGRALSKDLMSSWEGWKNFERPLFGAVKNTDSLKLGGDIRSIQTWVNNSAIRRGSLFLMQSNIELAYSSPSLTWVATAGTQGGPQGTPNRGQFVSERHYLLWETGENSRLRVGKFRQNFGLNDPNHTRTTKSDLGFGAGTENYQLEYFHWNENRQIFISGAFGRIDRSFDQQSERNLSLTVDWNLDEKSKLGMSVLMGESPTARRSVVGGFGLLPLTTHGVFKFESDVMRTVASNDRSRAIYSFTNSLTPGYFLTKGLLAYLTLNSLNTKSNSGTTREYRPGAGIQWLPLPHLEIQAEYTRIFKSGVLANPTDSAWLLVHVYL